MKGRLVSYWEIARKKISATYLLSLFLIFLVPFIVLTISLLVVTDKNRQQTQQITETKALQNATNQLNDQFDHLLAIARQGGMDPAISSAGTQIDAIQSQENAILRYQLSSPLITKLFIRYSREPNELVASDGTYDTIPTISKYGILSDDSNQHQRQVELLPDAATLTTSQQFDGPATNLLVPVSGFIGGPNYATFIFKLDTSAIQRVLEQSVDTKTQNLAFVTQNQLIMAAPNSDMFSRTGIDADHLYTLKTVQQATQRSGLTLSKRHSTNGLFSVMSFVKPLNTWRIFNDFLWHFGWILLLIIGAGVLCIELIKRRQYQFLSDLQAKLAIDGISPAPARSEEEKLQAAIAAYVQHQDKTEQLALRRLPLTQEQVLQQLLSGRIGDASELEEQLQVAQITFPYRLFVVALSRQDAKRHQYTPPVKGHHGVIHFATQLENNYLAMIINFDRTERLQTLVEDLRSDDPIWADQQLFFGEIVMAVQDIQLSFIHAASLLATTPLQSSTTGDVYYSADTTPTNAKKIFNQQDRIKLNTALTTGDTPMALEAFDEMFSGTDALDPNSPKFDLGSALVISQVLQADYQLNHRVNETLINDLLTTTAVFDRQALLRRAVSALSQNVQHHLIAPLPEDNDLVQYLAKHSSSADFSLNDVADYLGVSQSRASREVKKATGETFTAFLQTTRMTRIKEELLVTDDSIKTIIARNGYYDVSNFTRKFHQLTGQTPTQFRDYHADNS